MLDLDALEKIGKEAAEGPWLNGDDHNDQCHYVYVRAFKTKKIQAQGFGDSVELAEGNAEFIQTARNNWQALIDRIREQDKALREAEDILEDANSYGDYELVKRSDEWLQKWGKNVG